MTDEIRHLAVAVARLELKVDLLLAERDCAEDPLLIEVVEALDETFGNRLFTTADAVNSGSMRLVAAFIAAKKTIDPQKIGIYLANRSNRRIGRFRLSKFDKERPATFQVVRVG